MNLIGKSLLSRKNLEICKLSHGSSSPVKIISRLASGGNFFIPNRVPLQAAPERLTVLNPCCVVSEKVLQVDALLEIDSRP